MNPQVVALKCSGQVTYVDLYHMAVRVAKSLLAMGVDRSRPLGIKMARGVHWYVCTVAASMIGVPFMWLSSGATNEEIESAYNAELMQEFKPQCIIVEVEGNVRCLPKDVTMPKDDPDLFRSHHHGKKRDRHDGAASVQKDCHRFPRLSSPQTDTSMCSIRTYRRSTISFGVIPYQKQRRGSFSLVRLQTSMPKLIQACALSY